MTLYEMQERLRYFRNLREQLEYVVRYTNNCADNLNLAVRNCLTSYNVDGHSAGNDVLKKSYKKLTDDYNTIKNTILPAINNEISKLKKKIEEEQLKLM